MKIKELVHFTQIVFPRFTFHFTVKESERSDGNSSMDNGEKF